MSEKKNHIKDLILWGSESKENKKKAIAAFAFAISALNGSDKKLSEKELEKLAGGFDTRYSQWNING